jgi:hypothetical protein
VRDAQDWGALAQDRSVAGSRLMIGGIGYASGLGAHAKSFIRLRFKREGTRLRGWCGIDASAGNRGQVSFRIRDDSGRILFQSGILRGGAPAQPFSVPLAGKQELLLEALAPAGIDWAHADWADLRLE